MTRVDQFESVFRSASKEVYHPTSVPVSRVHLVTDLEPQVADKFMGRLQRFLSVLGKEVSWSQTPAAEGQDLGGLLESIKSHKPDMVCTYRGLFSSSWHYPYSLGEHVDVLTQVAPCPVLVVPHPKDPKAARHVLQATSQVLAMGGHLTGDHSLVDWALRMTEPQGNLCIAHIEDSQTAERYIDAISKIETIDTQDAREALLERLLKEPREYIESVARAVQKAGIPVRIDSDVGFGHRLGEYRRMINHHAVELLVMHTKDDDQLAMHGLAYPLAVELRQTPLLLL